MTKKNELTVLYIAIIASDTLVWRVPGSGLLNRDRRSSLSTSLHYHSLATRTAPEKDVQHLHVKTNRILLIPLEPFRMSSIL